MQVIASKLHDVKIIQPNTFQDERGYFLETFSIRHYKKILGDNIFFVQDNFSHSNKNVLRGLHFQKNYPQGKIIHVIHGEIFDVIVDIRPNSPTYGQWESFILSGQNKTQIWIPPNMAHGFLVLSEHADVSYKCTDYYHPNDECCLIWNDPTININWPRSSQIILSDKDKKGALFSELFPKK